MKKIDKTKEELLKEIKALTKVNVSLKKSYMKDVKNRKPKALNPGNKSRKSIDSNTKNMTPEDEKIIRKLFNDYIKMYASRDDKLTTHFSDDFSGFTGGGDFLVKDKTEWVAITRQDFAQVKEPIRIEVKDLAIQMLADTVAVTTGFFTIHLPIKDHVLSRETARLVLIFHKESDNWKISHSSISIPYYLVREGEVYPLKELTERNQLLEEIVKERTIQLSAANDSLRQINKKLAREIVERKQAEEEQRKIKLQYDNLVSNIPVGIYQMRSNPEGVLKLEYISAPAAKMFNVSVEHFMKDSLNILKVIHPDDLDSIRKLNQEGMKYRRPFDWEGRIIVAGVVKWLHIVSSPELLENGDVLWNGLVVDVTERKKAEELLRESEQKYRLLVNSANEAIVVIQGGMLRLSNPILKTMTGYSQDEIDLTPFPLFIHPDDRAMVVDNHKRRLRGEKIPTYYVFRLLNKDGSPRWVHMNAVLIDWEGSPATLNFLTDVTELKLTENALQQSSQKFEAVISASPDGIGLITLDGKIINISNKLLKIHGYSTERIDEIIGRSIFDFIDSSDHKLLKENTRKLLEGESEHELTEYLAIKKDKSRFHIDVKASVLRDQNGDPTSILYVERDISERKRSEEEILQKNRELAELNATKDKFFSIIAHDLKSPFQGLIGYSQILSSEYAKLSEKEIISIINSIEKLSTSSYKLLENLLDWSRIQTGQMTFNPENFVLLVELYPTLALVKHTAQNKGIEFSYAIDNSIFVKADKNMLSTIVRNLVSNSIKFTNTGGKISLTARKLNDIVEIKVSDTGVGIEKENIDKLFEIDKSISRKGTANEEGTGLGLLLCKEMIGKHNGIIHIESEIGKGSTFTFTIPAS